MLLLVDVNVATVANVDASLAIVDAVANNAVAFFAGATVGVARVDVDGLACTDVASFAYYIVAVVVACSACRYYCFNWRCLFYCCEWIW